MFCLELRAGDVSFGAVDSCVFSFGLFFVAGTEQFSER